ncbi:MULTISPECIES: hypothetical protein [Nocardia]|uniref:hypothetical protein n=1 Tax=Nocardia TaxID=1817 RepID=UPI00245567B8|nr:MULTISPECIES: hypothetical protein [Nocardia]
MPDLVRSAPSNLGYQRDLALMYERLADLAAASDEVNGSAGHPARPVTAVRAHICVCAHRRCCRD